jgi:MoaA/NifB/PqqE/SkfB family radical SAM enzyme
MALSVHAPNSPFKVVHHPDRIEAMRAGRQPAPVQVQMVLSDYCNQACWFCAYRTSGSPSNQLFAVIDPATRAVDHNPRRFLPTAKALEALEDCRELGVKAVDFTGGGEPTLHPEHPRLFARTLELGLDLALMTNGVVLRDEALEPLAHAKFVRFSLDAGTALTYAAIRRADPALFGRVLRHVALLAARRHAGSELQIGVNFVVTRENWHELEQAARAARAAGATYFRIASLLSPAGAQAYEGVRAALEDLCERVRALEGPGFRVFGQVQERLSDLDHGAPEYRRCGHMQLNTFIGADQNVYRCCTLAYNRRGLIGSIAQQRFRDLWGSPAKEADFLSFDARGCPWCPVNQKNRFINYLVETAPPDVNFV